MLYDHSSAPTRENAANWITTKMTRGKIIAFCPSRSVRVDRMRWTISWSDPWLAIAKMAPPMIAVGRANGLVSTCASVKLVSKSWNLPASRACE